MKKMPLNEKNVLWDHRAYGAPELCLPTKKRNASVILKDRTVGLASRILESMHKNEGFVLGSVNADKSSEGLVLTVDRFEEQQRQPKLMLPGDLQIPISFWKKSCLLKAKTVEDYLNDLKSLLRQCGERSEVDLSNVVKIEIKCQLEGPNCSVQVEALMPSTTFKIVPIPPVPVAATALYNSLTSNNGQSLPKSGLITVDQSKKIVYILENDPRVSTTKLVGLWVSGVDVAHDPYVWAACLRYVTCPAYVCRICLPPKPFLLALCTTVNLEPEYYDCFALGGIDFQLLSGHAGLTVTKVPSFGSRITVLDLLAESDPGKLKLFSEAKRLLLKERNEKISFKKPVPDIQSNVDDFPRMTPVAQQVQNMEFKPLVPDVSLLSEPGSGNTRPWDKENLADDYRVLLKTYPLQTINMNSQQTLPTHGKSELLHNRNPLVNLNSKSIDPKSKLRCNDENEPPVPTKAPQPHSILEGQSAINANFSDAVLNGNSKHLSHSARLGPSTRSVSPKEISHLPLETPRRFIRAPIGRHLQSTCSTMAQPSYYSVSDTGVNGISGFGNGNANHCHPHYNQNTTTVLGNKGSLSLPAANFRTGMPSNFRNAENVCIPYMDKPQENVRLTSDHTQKTSAVDNLDVANSSPRSVVVSGSSQNFATVCRNTGTYTGRDQCSAESAERSPHLTNLQSAHFLEPYEQPRTPIDCRDSPSTHNEKTDFPNICSESAQPVLNLSSVRESGSIEIQKIIEEQDSKLRKLQEQIQLLLQAQTLEEKTEPKHPTPSRKSQVLEDEEKLEVYKMLKHQDEQLQLLQEQIKTVLDLHQSSPNNKRLSDSGIEASPADPLQGPRCNVGVMTCCGETESSNGHRCEHQKKPERRSSDSGLESSPANTCTFPKSRCNVGVMTNHCGETEPSCRESSRNGNHCEHQQRMCRLECERQRCSKCDGCSCSNQANSSLTLKSLNIPTVSELQPSLPPSFHVDMKDYEASCCSSQTSRELENRSLVLGESVSYFRNEQMDRRPASSDESCDDIEHGDTFCQQLLGNINCFLERQRDSEKNGADTQVERYGFDSFLLPKLNYQTFHLSNVDSDLGDLALKYLGQQQIRATMSSTKVFMEKKLVHNEAQPSDTTLYGLSPSNISYSTKMYLERHGLAPSGSRLQAENESQSFWVFSDLRKLKKTPQGMIDTDTSRILDLEALKRQPKLL